MSEKPFNKDALEAASLWFVRQTDSDFSEADRVAWLAWREQSPANEAAWQAIEQVTQKFVLPGVATSVGIAALDRPASPARRRAVQQLAVMFALGGTSWAGYRQLPWQEWRAEYVTAVGEQREIYLPDNSKVTLNTDSALDVFFTANERRLLLHKGELFIETAHAKTEQRPFVAASQHGDVQALGTQFSLRTGREESQVDLFDGAVEIHSSQSLLKLRLNAGETARFTHTSIVSPTPLFSDTPRWLNGILVADNQPLSEFIAELSRYRHGYLLADESLANLRISGAFPIADTNAILDSISRTLPVSVQRFTNYWVRVTAAES